MSEFTKEQEGKINKAVKEYVALLNIGRADPDETEIFRYITGFSNEIKWEIHNKLLWIVNARYMRIGG